MNRPAVEAGLALLDSGGDFADGVLVLEGKWLGGEMGILFDSRRSRCCPSRVRPPFVSLRAK